MGGFSDRASSVDARSISELRRSNTSTATGKFMQSFHENSYASADFKLRKRKKNLWCSTGSEFCLTQANYKRIQVARSIVQLLKTMYKMCSLVFIAHMIRTSPSDCVSLNIVETVWFYLTDELLFYPSEISQTYGNIFRGWLVSL